MAQAMQQTIPKKPIPAYVYVVLIVFWPVGLYLLYKHLTSDKTNMMQNSKTMRYFAIGFLVFGAISILYYLPGLFGADAVNAAFGLGVGLAIAGGGVMILKLSAQAMQTAQRYRSYIAVVINQGNSSLHDISRALAIDFATVEADLNKMIEIGYFPFAYIDARHQRIVLPVRIQAAGANENTRVVRCGFCGANNKLVGNEPPICEYCGSSLV